MRPNVDQLREASKHLHYEISMFDFTARELAILGPSQRRDALLESFTIHARILTDVFFPAGGEDSDVFAQHYFDDPMTWKKARGPKPTFDVRANVGTQIAHLSYKRLDIGPEAKNWPVAQIHAELMRAVRVFQSQVSHDRLSPEWQDFGSTETESVRRGVYSTNSTNLPLVVLPISVSTIPSDVSTPAVNSAVKRNVD